MGSRPLSARATVPLRPALPSLLLRQFHGPRNVSASALQSAIKRVTCLAKVLDLLVQGRDLLRVLRPLPLVLRGQLPMGSSSARVPLVASLVRNRIPADREPCPRSGSEPASPGSFPA